MQASTSKPKNTDEYIAQFSGPAKELLTKLRAAIKDVVPQAEELLSYSMPSFKQDGTLVWYAGYKQHVGLYPRPSAIVKFKKELSRYKTSKGAIQFPLDKALPTTLVKTIIKFRLKENAERASLKVKKKNKPKI